MRYSAASNSVRKIGHWTATAKHAARGRGFDGGDELELGRPPQLCYGGLSVLNASLLLNEDEAEVGDLGLAAEVQLRLQSHIWQLHVVIPNVDTRVVDPAFSSVLVGDRVNSGDEGGEAVRDAPEGQDRQRRLRRLRHRPPKSKHGDRDFLYSSDAVRERKQ